MEAGEIAGAFERLDRVARELREKCPWDREQDARSIVPHAMDVTPLMELSDGK